MKSFIADILPKIGRYSQKLNNLTLLANQHWMLVDTFNERKIVYIFRKNNELLLSADGKVERAKWEFIGNQSLLIDRESESSLLKLSFFDESILALKYDNSENYMILINEEKTGNILKTLDAICTYLEKKYLATSLNEDKQKGLLSANKPKSVQEPKFINELIDNESDAENNRHGSQIFTICLLIIIVIFMLSYFLN